MNELKVESSRIAAAIRGAFGSAAACHCQGPAKLSEEEVLSFLAERRVVRRTDLIPSNVVSLSDRLH